MRKNCRSAHMQTAPSSRASGFRSCRPRRGWALDHWQVVMDTRPSDDLNARPLRIAADAVPIRTLIVDDEPLARQRLRDLCRQEIDVEVVGECSHGGEAVLLIEEMRPDLPGLAAS